MPRAGCRQDVDQQAKSGVALIGGRDKPKDFVIAKDDIAGLCGVRQRSKPDLPGPRIRDPRIVIGCYLKRGVQRFYGPVDACGCKPPDQAIAPPLKLLRIEQRNGFA